MDFGSIDFENLANGLLVLIVGLLSWLGFKSGRGKASASVPEGQGVGPMHSIAGAVIDNRKADELISAVDRNTAAHDRNTEAVEDSNRLVAQASHEVSRLGDELIRAGRGGG